MGDKEITGEVKSKDKAREKYDDAIARGDLAALMQFKDTDENLLLLSLGNVNPGQLITLTVDFIEQAKIFESSYNIIVP